jgi:L-lactate dehydrogenase complex protein LldG
LRSIDELNPMQAVVTTCEAAIASTGTILLVHGGAQGRRAITLLPDHHICVLRRDQVFELVPETWESIAAQSAKPITTISGPSATSDIEMTRIRGVHGPRRLTVILYG